jgi:hypothetical protein
VKIVKNERNPPLFTGKLLIKFQNILRNKMSTPKRKRSLLDFRQKREIVEIKNTTNNETWEAARHRYIGK